MIEIQSFSRSIVDERDPAEVYVDEISDEKPHKCQMLAKLADCRCLIVVFLLIVLVLGFVKTSHVNDHAKIGQKPQTQNRYQLRLNERLCRFHEV